jgi:hypothetical protein
MKAPRSVRREQIIFTVQITLANLNVYCLFVVPRCSLLANKYNEDTKAKSRHLKKLTSKETLLQVFSGVYIFDKAL